MQRTFRIAGSVVALVAVVGILFLAWQYTAYRASLETLPQGMTMAGLPVEGMTREQALNALEVAFATPLEVAYQEEWIALSPSSVELRFDAEQTAANLGAALTDKRSLDGFISYVMRQPTESVNVPVAVYYSEDRLEGFLARVASQYDHPPKPLVPLPDSLTFRSGRPGYELSVEPSRARVAEALISPIDTQVRLVVEESPPPPKDLDVLEDMIHSLVEDWAGLIPGVFIKDLQTGDELTYNAEIAYSGLSVLKVAILEETYRALESPIDVETTEWISGALGVTSSNFMANLLLRDVIGDGDGYQGADTLTASMQRLGLVNTFMATPYDEEITPPTIVTPANSRTDVPITPDPYMQTTPLDIGLLLEMIYQCSEGGGTLMAAYPDSFTAAECNEMIGWMEQNEFENLIEAGVPPETRVAQKHGFGDGGPHADAGIVWSPGGDFILVIYLDSTQYLEWADSSDLAANIATATYNYFNS